MMPSASIPKKTQNPRSDVSGGPGLTDDGESYRVPTQEEWDRLGQQQEQHYYDLFDRTGVGGAGLR